MAIYLSIAVQYDAAQRLRAPKSLFLVGHWGWFFIALFTGGFIGSFTTLHYVTSPGMKTKMPNQALEPTHTAVTDRAGARSAPAVCVAHL
jgi:hypothetical protein